MLSDYSTHLWLMPMHRAFCACACCAVGGAQPCDGVHRATACGSRLISSKLLQVGCSVAGSAAEAVAAGEVVVVVLADAAAIRSTLLQDPAASAALTGKWVVQMGTIGPEESIALAADIEAAGGRYVEAPVLGSQPEAEKGTLLVMVGSKEAPNGTPVGAVLEAFCE